MPRARSLCRRHGRHDRCRGLGVHHDLTAATIGADPIAQAWTAHMANDPWTYTTRWRVRQCEFDYNGHLSNAMHLNYVAQATSEHGEASGFGRAWSIKHGGAWMVRRHQITYRRPAILDDELELTAHVRSVGGVRGVRETTIVRTSDQAPIADIESEWVWVRLSDGRPTRVPQEIIDAYRDPPTQRMADDAGSLLPDEVRTSTDA